MRAHLHTKLVKTPKKRRDSKKINETENVYVKPRVKQGVKTPILQPAPEDILEIVRYFFQSMP